MRGAAIFDLDGTLLPGTSTERLFLVHALRARLLHPLRLAWGAAVSAGAWAGRRTASPFERKAYLAHQRAGVLEACGVAWVDSAVIPRLRPDLLERLETHRARGDALVLLSGTLDFLGMPIARALGFEFAICANLERRAGRFTGRVLPPHPHGAGKLQALVDLAARAPFDLRLSSAYANHGSDIAHLERVGFPHAVAPDRALRAAAEARHWPVWEAADGPHGSGPPR